MDMQKIGGFLAELRKEKNLTQEELGERIDVTNKTVSRWENGNYLPPVELLQILSKEYGVSINELLSGERLTDERYKQNAEEYIALDLMKRSKEAKTRIKTACVVAFTAFLAAIAIILLVALLPAPLPLRICGVAFSVIIIALGIGVCCVLTIDAGVYLCPECGNKFVPTMKEFIFGTHTFTKRKLKCPACGKKSYCKKKLD